MSRTYLCGGVTAVPRAHFPLDALAQLGRHHGPGVASPPSGLTLGQRAGGPRSNDSMVGLIADSGHVRKLVEGPALGGQSELVETRRDQIPALAERSATVVGDARVGGDGQDLARAGGGLMGDAIDGEGDTGPRRLGVDDRDRDRRGGGTVPGSGAGAPRSRELVSGWRPERWRPRHGIGPDRVEVGVFERVPPDQPFVDHDTILEFVDPTEVAVHGGVVAPPASRLSFA